MKRISFLNCAVAFASASCLLLVALVLGAVILFQRFTSETSLSSQNNLSVQYSHLESRSKPVESVVALVSDSENDWEALTRVVGNLENKVIPNAFHLGDVTQLGVSVDLREAKSITDSSSTKFHFVPGDRDLWKSSGLTNFNDVFGQSYQMVSIGSFNFLLIDNSNEYEGIDDEQWAFIESNIDQADFVILHNPIYFSDSLLGIVRKGMGQYSTEVEGQRQKLLTLIRGSNVKAVFAGDQHLFSETADAEKPELNHYVVGALNTERNIEQPNYVLLTLYTDGDYHVEQVYLLPSP